MGITAAEIAALKSSSRLARHADLSTEGLVRLCFGETAILGVETAAGVAPLRPRDEAGRCQVLATTDGDEDEDDEDEEDDGDDDDEDEDDDEEDDDGDEDEDDDGEGDEDEGDEDE